MGHEVDRSDLDSNEDPPQTQTIENPNENADILPASNSESSPRRLHGLIRFAPHNVEPATSEPTQNQNSMSPPPLDTPRPGEDKKDTSNERPESSQETIHRVQIEPERAGWARLSDLIRKYDQDRIQDAKEDIDTLLVFAGLFSAVITAFIIESYKTLQPQPEDTTNQILIQLSAQLASLAIAGSFVNSTAPLFTSPTFEAQRSSVLINTLWSLSVVIALITASLGILVKQWFREFLASDTQDPRELVKMRFFRDVGMKKWQVFELAAVLPLLLQLALVLFFIGFSILLHQLNPVVGWVTTGVMIVWVSVFLFATVAPAFSAQCPYKTPMLKGFLGSIRIGIPALTLYLTDKLTDLVFIVFPSQYSSHSALPYRLYQKVRIWTYSIKLSEETEVRKDESLDMPSLICCRDILRGEQLDETLVHCFQKCDVGGMFNCFQDLKSEQGPIAQGLFPETSQDMKKEVCRLYSELLIERQDLDELFRPVHIPLNFQRLYSSLTFALSEAYVPIRRNPIGRKTFEMLSKLIEEGSRPAAFAILTMYSVRWHTMNNHPDQWDKLFRRPSDLPESMPKFLTNIVAVTRALIYVLWVQPQGESNFNFRIKERDLDINIVKCIFSARWHSESGIPADPLILVHVFASLCYLIPPIVVQESASDIRGLMSQLADLITDVKSNRPADTYSHRECVIWTIRYLTFLGLVDTKLLPKLRELERRSYGYH